MQLSGSNEKPTESVSFAFQGVEIAYAPEKDDGTLDAAVPKGLRSRTLTADFAADSGQCTLERLLMTAKQLSMPGRSAMRRASWRRTSARILPTSRAGHFYSSSSASPDSTIVRRSSWAFCRKAANEAEMGAILYYSALHAEKTRHEMFRKEEFPDGAAPPLRRVR